MIGFSRKAKAYIRRRASGNQMLTDTCRITRPTGDSYLDANNDYVPVEGPVIYEGPCRLWESSSGMAVQIGDGELVVSSTFLSLPWDIFPIPSENDVCLITMSDDNDVIGRTVTLGGPARGGNLRATRKYQIRTENREQ